MFLHPGFRLIRTTLMAPSRRFVAATTVFRAIAQAESAVGSRLFALPRSENCHNLSVWCSTLHVSFDSGGGVGWAEGQLLFY